jgi:hypothetical protein
MKDYRSIYKNLAKSKNLESHHVVQYAILKAMESTVDNKVALNTINWYLSRSFTPVTRKHMLDNGTKPHGARDRAIRILSYAPPLSHEKYLSADEFARYQQLVNDLQEQLYQTAKAQANRWYVYTFVRQDISPEYQLVQAAHAAAKLGHRMGAGGLQPDNFDALYFAVIGVPDLKGLATAIGDCHAIGVPVHCFMEPDIGNLMTAFSTEPVLASERKRLLSYKKLRFHGNREVRPTT